MTNIHGKSCLIHKIWSNSQKLV